MINVDAEYVVCDKLKRFNTCEIYNIDIIPFYSDPEIFEIEISGKHVAYYNWKIFLKEWKLLSINRFIDKNHLYFKIKEHLREQKINKILDE